MSVKDIIAEAKAVADKLILRKDKRQHKEEAEDDYSFADEYFSIFY